MVCVGMMVCTCVDSMRMCDGVCRYDEVCTCWCASRYVNTYRTNSIPILSVV